jgi:hypothetical protein
MEIFNRQLVIFYIGITLSYYAKSTRAHLFSDSQKLSNKICNRVKLLKADLNEKLCNPAHVPQALTGAAVHVPGNH